MKFIKHAYLKYETEVLKEKKRKKKLNKDNEMMPKKEKTKQVC